MIGTLAAMSLPGAIVLAGAFIGNQTAMPGLQHLRCEYLVDPLAVDEPHPRLSWEIVDRRRGAAQTAYHVLVASSPERLEADQGDLWDTGKVDSDQSIQIEYAGRPLPPRQRAWWKVRIWDQDGQPSAWSPAAHWSMGLLAPTDWSAKWIGDPAPPPPVRAPNNGFHSQMARAADAEKWIAVDLGREVQIDAVHLHPARPYNWKQDAPGFLFPLRFRVEVARTADFAGAVTVVDRTVEDVADPGERVQEFSFSPVGGRHVRLTATRLRERDPGEFGLALAEMQVYSGDENVAAGGAVSASDSIERPEWSTAFLVDGDLQSHGAVGYEPLVPPMLRREFTLDEPASIRRATVYVTALGLYELRINGQRVGDHQLAPEWTDYHQRIQYQAYDVRALLRAGPNAIGVQLADGWYAGRIGLTQIVPGGPPRAIYGRQPRLLLQLELERGDGTLECVISDEHWRSTTEGPLRQADLLDGEVVDARRSLERWDQAIFDNSSWKPVGVFAAPEARLVAQPNEPIRVTREVPAIAMHEPQPGKYVFDLGQNMVGWCRVRLRGEPGQRVTVRHAEVLNPDGTLYTENLRSAGATERYTLCGDGVEEFEPRFTYHGFRYVELTGLREKPALNDVTGCVVTSSASEVGRFECSSELLNRLWQNVLWTQRANLHSTPTDCPQRDERLGWMGDILAFAQTACFNMDMAAFYTKWIPDIRDAQAADGRYPDFAPHPFDPDARFSGVPAWGDAGVFVPWCAYQNYGDVRILERHFESACRWIDWIHQNNPDLLWKNRRGNDYGDWLNADTLKLDDWSAKGSEMPKEVFATAFFARSTEIVAQMAEVLGRVEAARRYGALAQEIRQAFDRAYVQDDGTITGDTQAGYAIALHFGLLPESLRSAAAERMVACFAKTNGQISTGFHSTICLMNELTANGHTDEAYRLILNRQMPSWGYAIDHGATTMWERWDGFVEGRGFQNPGMNSFAHYAFGSVGEWMLRTIVGIQPDPASPAFKHFFLHPEPGGGLAWARGRYQSIRGPIECGWRIESETLALHVLVPANTTATLLLDEMSPDDIRESGKPLPEVAGIRGFEARDGGCNIELAAGTYEFTARRDPE